MKTCEKYKDKKIFICHVCDMDNEEYSILAKDDEEAKKILVNYLNETYGPFNPPYTIPYDKNDIYCMDIESIKEDMIKENNEIKLL